MSDSQGWIGWAFLGAGIGGAALFGALAAATAALGPASIPIWFIGAAIVLVVARSPLARAIASRIGGETGAVLPEVDDLYHRLAEVEERLDFAERLLAQPAQPVHGQVSER